jgi:transposase
MCSLEKEDSDYFPKGKSYLHSYCKPCFSKYTMNRWLQRKREAIEYKGGCCLDCGYKGSQQVYDFHHRDPKEKEFDWRKMRMRSWDSILKELDKCDLVCANCHRLRHVEMVGMEGTDPSFTS